MQEETATSAQLRAARSAIGWSVVELSLESGVSTATIKRYEAGEGVPKTRKGNLKALMKAFQSVGIEFIGTPESAPGIRIHSRPVDQRTE